MSVKMQLKKPVGRTLDIDWCMLIQAHTSTIQPFAIKKYKEMVYTNIIDIVIHRQYTGSLLISKRRPWKQYLCKCFLNKGLNKQMPSGHSGISEWWTRLWILYGLDQPPAYENRERKGLWIYLWSHPDGRDTNLS